MSDNRGFWPFKRQVANALAASFSPFSSDTDRHNPLCGTNPQPLFFISEVTIVSAAFPRNKYPSL